MYIGVVLVASIIDGVAFAELTRRLINSGPIETILGFVLLWPSFAVSAKRFHDRGMSGWWPLWLFLIFIVLMIALGVGLFMSGIDPNALAAGELPDPATLSGDGLTVMGLSGAALLALVLFQLVVLGFLPGQVGPNRYGADPLRPDFVQPA